MADATAGKIPHVLVIMDGVGHREAVEDNAFLAANRHRQARLVRRVTKSWKTRH